MKKRFIITLLAVFFVMGTLGIAAAYSSYLTSFASTYPASTSASTFSCGICHIDPAGGGPRNGYGTAYANAGHNFPAIESLDSDGDGSTNIAEITAGTNPGDATSYPAPVACTSFTYSAFSACKTNNTQTRTVLSSLPAGCTGGTPVLTQACTYVPPVTTCTSFTYSAFSACQPNNTQTRTVLTSLPAGCTGGTPVLTQACTYVPPVTTCTSFTYSAFSACQPNNTQNTNRAHQSACGLYRWHAAPDANLQLCPAGNGLHVVYLFGLVGLSGEQHPDTNRAFQSACGMYRRNPACDTDLQLCPASPGKSPGDITCVNRFVLGHGVSGADYRRSIEPLKRHSRKEGGSTSPSFFISPATRNPSPEFD